MYTKNFVQNGIREGRFIDASAEARARGYPGGIALTPAAARLGPTAVVGAVLDALAAPGGGALAMYSLVPFDDGRTQRMLVVECFSNAEAGGEHASWLTVDQA